MVLGGFDQMLKSVQGNSMMMSQGNNFSVVSNLSTAVSYIQNLAHMCQTGAIGHPLGPQLLAKLQEVDALFSSSGSQLLAMHGLAAQPMPQVHSPYMATAPVYGQAVPYQPQPMQMPPQVLQQPQPMPAAMPAPQAQPAPMPQAAPAPAPQPAPPPAQVAPAPAPAAASAPPPGGGSSPSVFSMLPGAGGGGDGDGKAAGRDFLLTLLSK